MAAAEPEKGYVERCCACLTSVRNNPRILVMVKVYTLLSGIFLFVAGLLGLILVFRSPFQIVISVYAMLFGFVVVVVEHGTWLDNVPLLKAFYQVLDQEFHMLATQRGKGFFYSGAGVLTLFTDGRTISLVGGASICLIFAGILHTFRIVHEEAINAKGRVPASQSGLGSAKDTAVPPAAPTYAPNFPQTTPANEPPPPPAAAGNPAASTSEWNSIVATQHEREGGADWGAGTAQEDMAVRGNERV